MAINLQFKNLWNKFKRLCLKHRLVFPYPRFWMLVSFLIVLIWFTFSLPKPLFKVPYSTVIEDCNGNFLSARIATDYQWRFPQNDSVPYKFRESLRLFEDEYFYYHPGINPISTFRALWQNIKKKRVVSGGSTISMQVIRLSLNNQNRSVFRKLHEIILTLRLEIGYSKDEILNLYVAHAPFGRNVVGLEAASWRYFGRPANRLSWGETTALAVLPNAPALVFPGKNHTAYLKKRNRLLDKLYKTKIIDFTTCELAKSEALPEKPQALPQIAPHLLNKVINDGISGKRIRTTLDIKLQQFANNIAKKYVRYYAANYIQNIAVMVLDTKSGEIKAYIGNVEIPGLNNSPFVDNVISNRSSGSILKPFLYAAMLNDGELLPHSLVSDIPTRFGAYTPENFEKTYQGVVPASVALAHSLNVPAVRELDQYGVVRFHHVLQQLGFSSVNKSPDYYGLSLILGGAEVNLWETTSIYASMGRSLLSYLSNNEKYRSDDFRSAGYLPYQTKSNQLVGHQKLNAAASWFTLEALSTVNRPWGEMGWEFFASTHKIAWKTGTSYGSRDAWSVGVTPEYTVGVWVGNSTGEGRPGLTGVTHASPVMFEIFKGLQLKKWFGQPKQDMVKVSVCKLSDFRATDNCENQEMWIPQNGVKVKACPFHQSIFLDSTRTYRVTSECYPVSKMQVTSWFVLPPSQEYFYRQNHPDYNLLPPYLSGCSSPYENVMDILSPDNNTAIYIPKGLNGETGMLIFEAVHRRKNATLYWHIDQEFITQTQGIHKIEVSPEVGLHRLTVEDDAGNIVRRNFKINRK
ncbi:MAG: penicillin-binding protein 1C [Paludibacter sp.]|nr:penicillin-binding protein 1C [Paludibacter sp.]